VSKEKDTTEVGRLKSRVATLEKQVLKLVSDQTRLFRQIQLMAPTMNTSISKSMKTTVIQKIQWVMRRGQPIETAIQQTFARLEERFGTEEISEDIRTYVTEQATRIYAEAAGVGWKETPDATPEETMAATATTTAGDPE